MKEGKTEKKWEGAQFPLFGGPPTLNPQYHRGRRRRNRQEEAWGGRGWSTFFSIGWRYESYGQQPYFLKNVTDMIASKI